MKLRIGLAVWTLLGWCGPNGAGAATATLEVDAGAPGPTFVPANVFGVNLAYWTRRPGLQAVGPKLAAAGVRFVRYPGGDAADDFHWNGTGQFDRRGHWMPDDTTYSASWIGTETYRGTTSGHPAAAKLTDGDRATRWLSNPDTDSPNAQWVYVDLGSAQSADCMVIDWHSPYATRFKVQFWNGRITWPLPFAAPKDLWTDTSAGILHGTGGTTVVNFRPVTSQCYRVLCLASSVSPAQYSIAEIRILRGTAQLSKNVSTIAPRIPGGGGPNGVPDQSWTVASSTDVACSRLETVDLDFDTFMAWMKSVSPQSRPLITVNVGTGTPQEAAAWVHYANLVRGYGIRDWEIGNETEWIWETGGPLDARDYGRRYIEFYEAMKAVDPSIRIYGPASGTSPYVPSNDHDGKSRIQGFVDRLAADPGGNKAAYAEGIDFHWYPLYGAAPTADEALATPAQLDRFIRRDLAAMLAHHPHPTTVPVLMTEFNVGLACPLTVRLSGGLWLADWLGTFVTGLGSRAHSLVWEAWEPGDADTVETGSSLGLFNGTENAYQYQPRAQFWVLDLLNRHWAQSGNAANQLVRVSSNRGLLTAYAVRRPDGRLSLLVINKDPINPYEARLRFAGFRPAAVGARWTFDAANYTWTTAAGRPFHADPDTGPTEGVETGIDSEYVHAFGPHSITVLQFTDAARSPTAGRAGPGGG